MHSYAFIFCKSGLLSGVKNLSCLLGKSAHIIRHSKCVRLLSKAVMQPRRLVSNLIVCPVQYAQDRHSRANRYLMRWNLAPVWQDSIKKHKHPQATSFRARRICHSFVPLFRLFMVQCALRAAIVVNKPWMNFGKVAAIRVTTEEKREIRHLFMHFM